MESLHVIFDARWDHERTGQHRTTSKYHSWAFDVGCWMFTWALNVECRKLNVDEHSTLNIQRLTPKAPLHPGSWRAPTSISTCIGDHEPRQVGRASSRAVGRMIRRRAARGYARPTWTKRSKVHGKHLTGVPVRLCIRFMKFNFSCVLVLAAAMAVSAGCYSTVGGSRRPGVPFAKDSIEGRYERPASDVYIAARKVLTF